MDCADAYSLGRLPSLYPYLLLILDKITEYWATYPSKTRDTGTPVELLKQCITTTGSTRRYLVLTTQKNLPHKKRWISVVIRRSFCNQWPPITSPCRHTLKVPLAAQSNTVESHSCAPTCLLVFDQTPQSTLRARKTLCGPNVMNTMSCQLQTIITCKILSQARAIPY